MRSKAILGDARPASLPDMGFVGVCAMCQLAISLALLSVSAVWHVGLIRRDERRCSRLRPGSGRPLGREYCPIRVVTLIKWHSTAMVYYV